MQVTAEHIDEVEKSWKFLGATEEDFPRLHGWVIGISNGNYKRYHNILWWNTWDVAMTDSNSGRWRLPPVQIQMKIDYDEWASENKKQDWKEIKKFFGVLSIVTIIVGFLVTKSC